MSATDMNHFWIILGAIFAVAFALAVLDGLNRIIRLLEAEQARKDNR